MKYMNHKYHNSISLKVVQVYDVSVIRLPKIGLLSSLLAFLVTVKNVLFTSIQ